jgi:hypothetical protein
MPWLDTSFLPQSETPETSKQQHLNLESAGESGSGLGCVCCQSDKAPQAPLVSEGAIWLGSEQGRQPPAVSSVAWSRAGAACVLSLPPRDKMTVSGERGGPTMQTDKIRDTNKHSESRGLGPDPLPRVRTVAPSSNSGSVRFTQYLRTSTTSTARWAKDIDVKKTAAKELAVEAASANSTCSTRKEEGLSARNRIERTGSGLVGGVAPRPDLHHGTVSRSRATGVARSTAWLPRFNRVWGVQCARLVPQP